LLDTNAGKQSIRLHIKPLYSGKKSDGALVMFEPISPAGVDGDGKRSALNKDGVFRSSPSKDGASEKTVKGNGKPTAKKKTVTKKLKRR